MSDKFAVQAADDKATAASGGAGATDAGGNGGGANLRDFEQAKGLIGAGRAGTAEEIPYESSVCSFSLRKDGVQISNNAVYFGRTYLSCDNVKFGKLTSNPALFFARIEHSSADSLKLSIVKADKMSTVVSSLTVTYRLLWSARLKSGTWGSGNSRFEVVDYRCIPQIPAYT